MKAILFCLFILVMGTTFASASLITFTDQATFDSQAGGTQLVNFDVDSNNNALSLNTPIDQQYISQGVDFNPFDNSTPKVGTFTPQSAPNVMLTGTVGAGDGGFEAVFSNPTNAVAVGFGGLQDIGQTTFEAFGDNNNSLGSFVVFSLAGGASNGFVFFGVISDENISRIEVSTDPADFVWFDDFQFGNTVLDASVPEPSSGILLLGTMIAFMLRFRFLKKE